ncbi:MAG TPA: bifunctional YncE family protein/alkaline phosphatase family protein [Bryobacteraceae bacterium]|nr:bifunctional YncE family protein/alkaline phosphatase family protein [Bryobacteraceae bacterium]
MPLRIVPVPRSPYLIVTSSGFGEQFLAVLNAQSEQMIERIPLQQAWAGLAVSADGRRVYASAGAEDRVLVYRFADGHLTPDGDIPLEPHTFPAGLALSPDGNRLYIAGNLNNSALAVDTGSRKVLYRVPVGAKPYACALAQSNRRLYVSNWGHNTVSVLEAATGEPVSEIRVQDKPGDLLAIRDGTLVFAANTDRNTVSVIDARENRVVEQIETSVVPNALPGSTPNALAYDARSRTLYVANADNNSVAVIDVTDPGKSRLRGFIPTAWYPTGVSLSASPAKLVVINGKGAQSYPNTAQWSGAISPFTRPGVSTVEDRRNPGYLGNMLQGTVSFVPVPDAAQLARYTAQVRRNSPLVNKPPAPAPAPPLLLGKNSPIRHVFYIIKENRTYDQVFGDMREGNGDPNYCLFPDKVTPNHHALARQFVLIDNLYHNAEVSATGHYWVNSAYSSDYVEKLWPSTYSGRGKKVRPEYHGDPETYPSHGFLWDLCARFGLTYRIYGEFAHVYNGRVRAETPNIEGHFNPTYTGADNIQNMGDMERFGIWLKEFRQFERQGSMPQFQVLSLPGDHTVGSRPGKQTPRAMLAENDLALGNMIDALTHSVFWKDLAIFVIEDDPQNGPDHVDCHRTVALVISPYVRHHFVDHTMYSAVSMLRTMELLLGLPPMSQYDASAVPMWNLFQSSADGQPYTARGPGIPLDEKNTLRSYGALKSMAMDLDEADNADDDELNEIVWKSVKGPSSAMPPRRIAAFAAIP